MTVNPPARAWLWRESTRRRLALFTLVLFVLSTYGPGTLALAAPQLFARPGSGVSRLPLDVLAFDAPGFGEVADAVNLASGSVYVDLGDLARANLAGGGDELVGTVGEAGWTLKPRLRLEQFRRNMTLAEAPNNWFLALGDGGGITFTRASLDWNALPLSVAPSWVRRYQGLSNVAIYRADDRAGTQPKVEFLVLVFSGGLAWAHYYDMAGNRHTFHADGPYLDYVQDPYQQYRSAQGGAPEGNPLLATDFFYADTTYGRISRVRDEWGRTTIYQWAGSDLEGIYYLLRDPNDIFTWSRAVTFSYQDLAGQRLVRTVTYHVYDGLGFAEANKLRRQYVFSYSHNPSSNRVRLSRVERPVLGGLGSVHTVYEYDAYDRITKVRQLANGDTNVPTEPDINYYYSSAVPITLKGSQAQNCVGVGVWAWGLPRELGVVPLWCTSDTGTFTVPASVTPGQYKVVLVARGEKAYGAWPTLAFRLNGAQQFTRTIDQVVYREYDLGTYSLAAGHTLGFEFTNDACECSPYTDRNAFLAEVRLEPVNQGERVVTVMQGSGDERKETNYHFDAQGQLVKRRVWDYNPWAAGASGWFGHSPRDKTLEWTYSYYGSGATASVTDPAGKKTTYGYDMLGNLTLREEWLGTNRVRHKFYGYTSDNRLAYDITPAYVGEGYNYGEVHVYHEYTYHPTVTVGGQTFRSVASVNSATHVNEPGVGWQWKRSTVSSYDAYGRLTESRRKANGQPDQTTTYTYHTGGTWQPYLPNASGDYGALGPAVRQYGDLVYEKHHEGRVSRYFYDALGNVNHELLPGQHTADYSGASEVRHYRWAFRSYNGFGQQVWETLVTSPDGNNTAAAARRMWYYYATGELNYSWEGTPQNLTDYRYSVGGRDLARRWQMLRGVGNNGEISTQHELTTYGYDDYGRAIYKTVDGFTYRTRYDTLDRVVEEVLPDGGWQVYTYSRSGTPDFECSGAAGARIDSTHCQYKTVDALGRVTSVLHAINPGGTNQAGMTAFTVGTAYDPFDRPVRVENNALTMNAGGAERTTYFVYDSLGNLIKQLDPPLRTNPSADAGGTEPGYTDGRRPYVEYSYDSLGRRTQERRLLAGDVTPAQVYSNLYGSFAACGSSAVACTGTAYDALDRPVTVTDPEGYATTLAYDPAGNLVGKTQQAWTGGEPDYATLSSGFTSVTTRYAYDGMGRVTKTVTPRGHAKRVVYDLLGNVTGEQDERGVYTKLYWYTPDGLLKEVLEPDNDPATSATTLPTDWSNGWVMTKRYEYGSRKYPSQTCVASMDSAAGSNAACTTHYYDYAGRVLTNVLPDGSVVNMSYDSRGHQTYLKDAEGFETEYTHDAWGNLVKEFKKSRGNQTDADAGFPAGGGVVTEYWYDYAGNLVKQRANASPTRSDTGLYTEYAYNSLGKVVRETRPHKGGVGTNAKVRTYRLDAQVTAETTYDYAGDLAGKATGVSVANMPSVTAGNATVMEYNRRGEKVREASQAKPINNPLFPLSNWDGREHTATFQYNGLGLKVKRIFVGSTRVYAPQRDTNGYTLGTANYNSYWKYDANSKLIEYWDTPASSSGDGTPLNASDKQNRYTYQYSPTNKETYHTRDVRFKVRSYYNTPNHDFSNGALMAATVGSATTAYNERDQVNNVSFTDQAPQDWSATGKATSNIVTYWYHKDGSKKKAQTGDGHYTQYSYDSRGRVVSVYDSNGGLNNTGNTVIPAGATTTTAYGSDGTQTQEVKNGAYLRYKRITKPTVGGLSGSVQEWTNQALNAGNANPSPQVTAYDDPAHPYPGMPYKAVSTTAQGNPSQGGEYSSTTSTTTFNYDGYGNVTQPSVQSVTSGQRWNPNCECYQPFTETTSYVPKTTTYNAANAVTTEVTHTTPGCNDPSCYGYTTTYTLDSRGNRLYVSDSRGARPDNYHGRTKRYNADGRAAEFHILQSDYGYLFGKPAGKTSIYTDFRYDPFGNQVMSSNGWTWEEDGYNQAQHAMYRETYTNVAVGGDVQLIRKQKGEMAKYWHPFGWYSCGWQWECRSDWNANNAYKDEAYSLADGALESQWTAVTPFNASPLFAKAPTDLALPATALSSQLRLSVGNVSLLDLRPPAAGPSGNTNTPAPPAQLTQPNQGQQGQPQTFGLSASASLTLTLLGGDGAGASLEPAGVTLPGLGGNRSSAETASRFGLSLPTSVLPPVLQALNTLDLRAPTVEDKPGSGLTPPGGGVVPPIGGVPAPIDAVVPPVGSPPPSGDEGDVFTQDAFQDFLKFLESVAKSVDDEARNKQQDQSGRLGDKEADELARAAAKKLVDWAYQKLGAEAANDLEMVNKATQFWSPQERLAFYLDLGAKMARQTQDQFGRRNLTAELKKMGEVARVARDANVIARGAGADLGVVVNYDKDGRPYVYDPNAHLRGLVDPTPGVVGLAANRLGSQLSPGFKNFALNKSLGGAVGTDAVYAAIGIAGGVVAGVKVLGTAGQRLLPGELTVGKYNDLRGPIGDGLAANHLPSSKYMQLKADPADGWTPGKGIAMKMEDPRPSPGNGRHQETYTYGLKDPADPYFSLSPRDALAFDIADVRRIYMEQGLYGPDVRRALQQVIQQNKQQFPNTFRK